MDYLPGLVAGVASGALTAALLDAFRHFRAMRRELAQALKERDEARGEVDQYRRALRNKLYRHAMEDVVTAVRQAGLRAKIARDEMDVITKLAELYRE